MAEELQKHIEALRGWIERQAEDVPAPDPGLTSEERKQLQTVNKSIEQLTKLRVSIPDDLRKLKLRLSARESFSTGSDGVEERAAEVEGLLEQLRELTQAARALRDQLKSTTQSTGTKKHYGVTLSELIQSGHLSTDDKLELQWVKEGEIYEGKVRADGTVAAKGPSGWKQYDTLSAAAADIGGRALNGWDHWRRVNRDGSLTTLKVIRDKYLQGGRP